MSWTYSGDPSTSSRDEVRFLAGDVTFSPVLSLSDAEVAWIIAQANETPPNLYHAAAEVAEKMASRAMAQVTNSRKLGDLEVSEDYKSTATELRMLAKQLMRGRTAYHPGMPVFVDQNVNQFSIGMNDDVTGFGPGLGVTRLWT